ncbi:MAG: hypothetical protein NUV77_23850 [Thermoguttaceae bacterium]|jgi:hypothetical protein|nr:hypothetical protein [Thermoguttaceae bacterium]
MEELTLEALIAKIKDNDAKVRAAAWQAAGKVGAKAVVPLAAVAGGGALEVARAANRALWQIVRTAGRPGAEEERAATVRELLEVLGDAQYPLQLRRDVIWMLSEIIRDDEINPEGAATLLDDVDLREDGRAALQRVPGERSLAALKIGFEAAEGDFKAALACSLRARGVQVAKPPCPKLVPTKTTSVKPIPAR